MKIAVIGTGRVGSALLKGWSGKGHTLFAGTRRADAIDLPGVSALTPSEAASRADVVVLALPWSAAEAAVRDLGDLTGKIVIDCMNPIGPTPAGFGLVLGHTTSGGEVVQGWLPGAKVIKSLNQVGAEVMADNAALSHRPVQFVAGNDEAAKATVMELLRDLGFDPLDAGDITKARILEPFAMVWINQALMRGKGRTWAFAAVS